MADNFKTHKIYANYPMDALNLRELEQDINNLDVNLGDIVVVDCAGMSYICSFKALTISCHKNIKK